MGIKAVGLIEVFGLTAAFVAGDAACKAANVTIESFDKNKPANAETLAVPLVVLIKLRGDAEDVNIAVEAAKTAAESVSGVIATHIIAAPDSETEKILALDAF